MLSKYNRFSGKNQESDKFIYVVLFQDCNQTVEKAQLLITQPTKSSPIVC